MFAQIRYYYKIEPKTLTNEEILMYWQDLKWIRDQEKQETKK